MSCSRKGLGHDFIPCPDGECLNCLLEEADEPTMTAAEAARSCAKGDFHCWHWAYACGPCCSCGFLGDTDDARCYPIPEKESVK